ncbi:MAG TPA: metal-dependent hydrolase [Thermoanaerobaculia bacterium]|jgi:inner membrane protein|nr:metal-dependent hydrolase [Thermoanaerobaculia bacterium]
MPTVLSHAVAGLGIGAAFFGRKASGRTLALGALCAVLPDADVAGFPLGIRYGDLLGHRGLTHSFAFAATLAALVTPLASSESGLRRGKLWTYLFLATASHGLLDALTDGGLGVALLAPFDNTRYFFPFRPIKVSPIGIGRFFSQRGWAVMKSELLWIWLPSLALAGTAAILRKDRPA